MDISVVIPTFNRARLLRESIPLLMAQEVSESTTYEVVFVSNGSSDDTEKVLQEAAVRYGDKFRYFVIAPSGGPAAPRNHGIREAKGAAIIILDDDIYPDKNLVQCYVDYHRQYPEAQAAAVGEAYIPESVKSNPVSLFHEFDYKPLYHSDIISYIYFWTCNISFKREFMLQHGMFDEDFLYNEDIVCGYSLAQYGMQLRFCPQARGQHYHQLKLESVPDKGIYVGRWIWATAEHLPEPEVLDRYGVLSPQLGFRRYAKRLINRSLFRLIDNRLLASILCLLGARSGKRSKISDLYYYLLYRRNIVEGFNQAKRRAAVFRDLDQQKKPTQLVREMPQVFSL